MKLSHILFPIDFSERSDGAVPHVEAWVNRFNAKLTLMHVINHGEFAKFVFSNDPLAKVLEDQLQQKMEEFAALKLPSIRTDRILDEGEPGGTIARFAHEKRVDLIMMPTHGFGPFRSLLLGSVTAKVLHDAQCPVWTGAHVEEMTNKAHLRYRTVLCAVDLSPRTDTLMRKAMDLAQGLDATVRFIHATPSEETLAFYESGADATPKLRQSAHARILGFMEEAGIQAPVCVCPGAVATVVREEALRHGADLIIIGRGLMKGGIGRLRAHAYGIIRESPCPVLSL